MNRSLGLRFLVVGLLALLMFIPLFFVGKLIYDRSTYSRDAISSVNTKWGGKQWLIGPQLIIPVEGVATRTEKRKIRDDKTGDVAEEIYEIIETAPEPQAPVHVFPDLLQAHVVTTTEVRHRGIFEVPVYTATSTITATFRLPDPAEVLQEGEQILWEATELQLKLQSNRALRGPAKLLADGVEIPLEPRAGPNSGGIFALIGDPRDIATFTLSLDFNGAESLLLAPVGRASQVKIESDWPHPSFTGAFLPDSSEVSDRGFSATWTIPHLARLMPQIAREDSDTIARAELFGVRFLQPNDFYQKAYRTLRYSILFIALTFLTVLLLEGRRKQPVHPVQYLLVGLAQSIFILLMTAYAEHLGFILAYLLSSGVTIGLLVMFGALGLKLGRRTYVLGTMLVGLYAVLYLILESIDYALLTGSTLAFVALAITMYHTRNENWYKTDKQQPGEALPRGPDETGNS